MFILGAGFSKPAGFPLATELTDEVLDSFEKFVGSDYELFAWADHVRRLHQWITAEASLPKLNIEEFYEYISVYAERFRLEQHSEPVGRNAGDTAYNQAEGLITMRSYLDEYLLEVLLEHEETARLSVIERFVDALCVDDAVITFNYDRLVERCLSKRKTAWSFGLDEHRTGCIPVLKMHGSLDWICFARHQRCDRKAVRRLFTKKDENRDQAAMPAEPCGEDEYDYELFQIVDDQRLRDFIEKRDLIQSDYRWGLAGLGPQKRVSLVPGLGAVWARALRALYEADHIVVVGFSFSQFDRLAQIEFARTAAGRAENGKRAPKVTVIDPALIRKNGQTESSGVELIRRIQAVFRSAEPVGACHENFEWASLSDTPVAHRSRRA